MGRLQDATIWIAIFDGGRALLFRRGGEGDAPLSPIETRQHDNPPSRRQGRERGGRFHTPAGGRSAAETPDHHTRAEHAFVDTLARDLDRHAEAGEYDKLIVMAPADLLRRFREKAPHAAGRTLASDSGDFTRLPKKTLEAKVDALIAEGRRAARHLPT